MRILFISDRLPTRLHDGGSLRTFHILRGLARSHEVDVLSHDQGTASLQLLREHCGIHQYHGVRPDAVWKRLLWGMVSGRVWKYPLFAIKNWSVPLLDAAEQLLATGEFDAVHFNHLDTACLALERNWRQSLVFDSHNCLSTMVREFADGETPKRPRWLYRREARMLADLEAAIVRRMGLVLACSNEDIAGFTVLNGGASGKFVLVPNGVDLDYFRPADAEDTEPGAIVFVGLMSYLPNEDAARYFCKEVLPLLSGMNPRPRVYLVGRNPSPGVKELHDGEMVIVTGEVADVRPYVAKAQVVVVPLRFGGGTRLKILEAFAMGKTVVSTSKGAEGIPATAEREILMANSREELATQVRRVLSSESLRTQIGRAAREFVRDRFGWERVQNIVADGYASLPLRETGRESNKEQNQHDNVNVPKCL